MSEYLFESDRLGFRNWKDSDIDAMTKISADPNVMRFFPKTATYEETKTFIEKMKDLFYENGYCYFAVETKSNKELIGFIGMMDQTYESEFTPATDIGWRLKQSSWGKGYATEGAMRCLKYAKENLTIQQLIATAPQVNTPSIAVMKKIGMIYHQNFIHPKLLNHENIKECVCYKIDL